MTEEKNEHSARRGLSFAQAEGIAPLPRQLELKEISKALRVGLAFVFKDFMETDYRDRDYAPPHIGGKWHKVLLSLHLLHDQNYPDDFDSKFEVQHCRIQNIIRNGDYVELFGMVQFVLSHPDCPPTFHLSVQRVLEHSKAAYRVVDRVLIVPAVSAEEGRTVEQAFADLALSEFNGARAHLAASVEALNQGEWAGSVRESIQAVEALARVVEPGSNTLGPALNRLEAAGHMHSALKKGMSNLYGYTSNEAGVRHSLLDDGDARVDESDALFMLGACASFVTYLIKKGRAGGIIQ